jgi:hypothetical protein
MLRRHTFHRGARWVTLLALLLATLAPGVAHALRHARGEVMPWSQLCSATGGKRIVLAQSADGSPLQQAHAFEHCVYCALHHDASLPALPAARTPLRADLAHAQAVPAPAVPHAAAPWRAALARAPPHIS